MLKQYPVVLMLGRIKLEGKLAKKLIKYVEEGGHLLVNVQQLGADAGNLRDFLGIKPTGEEATSTQSDCQICGGTHDEPLYRYSKVHISPDAEVMATNEHGDVQGCEAILLLRGIFHVSRLWEASRRRCCCCPLPKEA